MSHQPCSCCKEQRQEAIGGQNGYGFNALSGEDRNWAQSNKMPRSERCVPVNGGKRFGGPSWQKVKCGDGRMGFSMRRKGQEGTRMEKGLDGQWKSKRHTIVRTRSARCVASRRPRRVDGSRHRLVSNIEITEAGRDPFVVKQRAKFITRTTRTQNRNNRARRGHKRATKVTVKYV